jgi:hypothetical protein
MFGLCQATCILSGPVEVEPVGRLVMIPANVMANSLDESLRLGPASGQNQPAPVGQGASRTIAPSGSTFPRPEIAVRPRRPVLVVMVADVCEIGQHGPAGNDEATV